MIPSDAVGAPYTWGTPPAARTPSHPLRARRSRWALHGVMSLKRDATPTTGRSKSSSRKPTARSMARFGARFGPPVVVRLVRSPLAIASALVDGFCSRHAARDEPDGGPGESATPSPVWPGLVTRSVTATFGPGLWYRPHG